MSDDAASTLTSTNREFWNSKAASYNSTHSPLVAAILQAFSDHATWISIPTSGKVLDFACGTGLVSHAISLVNPSLIFRGIDISDRMIVKYKERFQELGGGIDADAVEVDLMDSSSFKPGSPIEGPDWLEFDMVAVANSLHHIQRTEVAVARLVERLKVRGVLCVIDWVDDGKEGGHGPHHGHGHGHKESKARGPGEDEESLLKKHGVAHRHGFTETRITKIMQDAGLENVGSRELEGPLKFGDFERRVFVARGTKAKPTKLGFSKATPWTLMH